MCFCSIGYPSRPKFLYAIRSLWVHVGCFNIQTNMPAKRMLYNRAGAIKYVLVRVVPHTSGWFGLPPRKPYALSGLYVCRSC